MTGRFNVENDEFDRLRNVGERREGGPPVDRGGNVGHGEGEGIDQVNLVADSVTDAKLSNVGEGSGNVLRDADNVVLANGNDLDRVGLFRIRRCVLLIHRNQLLRSLGTV